MNRPLKQKWLAVIPMAYREGVDFWERDNGVLCLALRNLGVDARFVALGSPIVRNDVPLILGELEDFHNPVWWKQWAPDGVILNSWGVPRYEGVARAIRATGAKLVIRLDSDGFKSPRVDFIRYVTSLYTYFRDAQKPFPMLNALGRAICFRAIPALQDRPMCLHLSHADILLIESPLGKQTLAGYLRRIGKLELAEKLRVVPHLIKDGFRYDPTIPKAPTVVCVARWDAWVKDAPLLMRVLERALAANEDYTAKIIGPGTSSFEQWQRRIAPQLAERIQILGAIPNDELHDHYLRARIILFTSRSEGFPLAAAEAVSCGCSVVGPGKLPGICYLASESSGTVALKRTRGYLCDALGAEMDLWRVGARDPQRISDVWVPRVAASAVARQILSFFKS
jgi:hypothetical protein